MEKKDFKFDKRADKSEEMRSRFEKQGFRYIGVKKDRYAQLVIFEKL